MDSTWASVVAAWILPPTAIGALALFEVKQALDGAPRLWSTCWRVWVVGFALFAAWGLVCYLCVWLLKGPGRLQVAGGPPADLTLAFAAIVLAQGLRVEAPRKAAIEGSRHGAIERESYYARGLRMLMSDMYRDLVNRLPDNDTELKLLLRRGLVEAYPLDVMLEEFRGWAETRPDPPGGDLIQWARSVRSSRTLNPRGRATALVERLIRDDVSAARHLARRRAAAIVDLRAF